MNDAPMTSDIREHFEQIKAMRATISDLEARQTELAQRIEALSDDARLAELRGRLEDVAAAVELKERPAKDLDRLRAEIAEAERETAQTAETRRQLEAAANGLARRLTAARADLAVAEGQSRVILRDYLRARFAAESALYETRRLAAREAWLRLKALAELAATRAIALGVPVPDVTFGGHLEQESIAARQPLVAELKELGAL